MNRREFLIRTGTLAAGAALAPLVRAELAWGDLPVDAQGGKFAEGFVFDDRNGSGRLAGQRGIAGVCVSNGREVTKTDRNRRVIRTRQAGYQTDGQVAPIDVE